VITDAILDLLGFVLHAVLSLIPAVPTPSWLTSGDSSIDTVFQDAGLMSVWFPISLATTVLTAIVTIWLAGFAIKLGRMVVSLFTGGGGSAA
jgi:hypothetical protein